MQNSRYTLLSSLIKSSSEIACYLFFNLTLKPNKSCIPNSFDSLLLYQKYSTSWPSKSTSNAKHFFFQIEVEILYSL